MGNSCSAEQNVKPPSSNEDTRPLCRFYANGYCRYGTRCRYSHNIPPGTRALNSASNVSEEVALQIALAESKAAEENTVVKKTNAKMTVKKQLSFEHKHLQRQHSYYGLEVSVGGNVSFVKHHDQDSTSATKTDPASSTSPKDAWILSEKGWDSAVKGYTLKKIPGLEFSELERVSRMNYLPKLKWFRDQMQRRQVDFKRGQIDIVIDREDLLEDSVTQIMKLKGDQLRKQWRVRFNGEKGLDAGGVTRAWIELVMKSLFNPNNGLFKYSAGDNMSYFINPSSGMLQPKHRLFFRFAGRMIGRTLLFHEIQPCYFVETLYKHMIASPITVKDLAFFDAAMYSSIRAMLDMRPDMIEDALMLDFSITVMDAFGTPKVIELVPGGTDIAVTGHNRREYISRIVKYYMYDSCKYQIESLLQGVYEVVPHSLLSVFDYRELELTLSGHIEIDVTDWEKNTVYDGYKATDPVIRWFFKTLREYTHTKRAKFLQFVTGISRVPVGGFAFLQSHGGKLQKFNIKRIPKSLSVIPRAHTCFNRLEMPAYATIGELQKRMGYILDVEKALEFTLE
eukprot:g233.t1